MVYQYGEVSQIRKVLRHWKHCIVELRELSLSYLWEMSNADVMKKANWSSLASMYKISLAKLMYKIYNNLTPDAMSVIIKNNDNIK